MQPLFSQQQIFLLQQYLQLRAVMTTPSYNRNFLIEQNSILNNILKVLIR